MRKPLLLVPALLLAGCRSEQVAFHFQPAPPAQAIARVPAATPASLPPATAEPAMGPSPAASSARPARLRRPHAPKLLAATPVTSPLATITNGPRLANSRVQLLRKRTTSGAAESGLGRTVLFILGMVLAVLAGLAALVNVIFGVGFFTALGYTAAGVVVLFLLYKLLSGGKKKK